MYVNHHHDLSSRDGLISHAHGGYNQLTPLPFCAIRSSGHTLRIRFFFSTVHASHHHYITRALDSLAFNMTSQ